MKNTSGIIASNIKRTKIKNRTLMIEYYIIKKYSTRKIAKLFNVEPSTISRTLRRMKIKTKYRVPINKTLVFDLYINKLLSVAEVARKLKCSTAPLYRILKELNIKIRPKDFYTKLFRNGRWLGGKSFEPYPILWTNKLKEFIRIRDNHKCQKCKTHKKEKLSVHHIDYNKENCNEKNLITLCRSCHTATNSNRDYWYAYFTYIMENRT